MHSGRLWIIMLRRQEQFTISSGNCDLKLGKAKEALNYYNLGLEQDDVSKKMKKEMKYNIIVAYEKMEDWESAEVKLEEYLDSYPNDKAAKKEAEFLETR